MRDTQKKSKGKSIGKFSAFNLNHLKIMFSGQEMTLKKSKPDGLFQDSDGRSRKQEDYQQRLASVISLPVGSFKYSIEI